MPARAPKDRAASAAKKRAGARIVTYWLTRDSAADGTLSDAVDVWLARPKRVPLPGGLGATWICDDVVSVVVTSGDVPARYAVWTVQQCFWACRTQPDSDRECIKVGGVDHPLAKA